MSNQNVLVVDEGAQDAGFRRVRWRVAQHDDYALALRIPAVRVHPHAGPIVRGACADEPRGG